MRSSCRISCCWGKKEMNLNGSYSRKITKQTGLEIVIRTSRTLCCYSRIKPNNQVSIIIETTFLKNYHGTSRSSSKKERLNKNGNVMSLEGITPFNILTDLYYKNLRHLKNPSNKSLSSNREIKVILFPRKLYTNNLNIIRSIIPKIYWTKGLQRSES